MDVASPSRLAQPLVSPASRPYYMRPQKSVLQTICKALYAISVVVVVVGMATDTTEMWQVAYGLPVLFMALLVAVWKMKPGWVVSTYSAAVMAGFVFLFAGQVMLVQNEELGLFYFAFLLFLVSVSAFALAFWTPSVRVSHMADVNVDTSSSAIPTNSAGVPLHALRLLPVAAMVGGAAAAWRTLDWAQHPATVPVSIYVAAMGIMLWRAAARVGYRVPIPTNKVKEMLKRSAMKRLQEWEKVDQQWCALGGAMLLVGAHCLLAYQRLWDHQAVWLPYTCALLQYIAAALIAASVPLKDAPLPSLRDPSLCPPPYDGVPMRVLFILPDRDFDVTEVSVPWFMLHRRGHDVVFATEHGTVPSADPLLLTGVLCGKLGADPLPKQMYFAMENDPAFLKPIKWSQIVPEAYDGLILPGGHAPGMRQYLGSKLVQRHVDAFWQLDRPIGAICHGVLVLARTRNSETNKSVLDGCNATCLPKYMENSAYALTCCCRGRYYRTYPATVQSEVVAALGPRGRFYRGPVTFDRATPWEVKNTFVVEHGQLITSRWPGDAFEFSRRFLGMLEEVPRLY